MRRGESRGASWGEFISLAGQGGLRRVGEFIARIAINLWSAAKFAASVLAGRTIAP
jgi:hypothetical protein